MTSQHEPTEVRLDRRSVRVLAHPLRNRLLSQLRLDGPATATELARRLDTNTGATSYHLRKLAEVGLVEEAGGGVGRERRWRAAHEFTALSPADVQGDPDAEAALAWLTGDYFEQFVERARGWAQAQAHWPLDWREAAGASDTLLELTAAQLRAMQDEIWQVTERYRIAGRDAAEAGGDAEERHRVFFFMHSFPDAQEPR